MNYIDTSVIVAALTKEPHTPRAERLLTTKREAFAISHWTIAEFSSALSIKLRVGSINMERRSAALEAFQVMSTESFILLPITSAHFVSAARLSDRSKQGLRAGDALHLAIAQEEAATLCTLDKRLSAAGKALGVATRLI